MNLTIRQVRELKTKGKTTVKMKNGCLRTITLMDIDLSKYENQSITFILKRKNFMNISNKISTELEKYIKDLDQVKLEEGKKYTFCIDFSIDQSKKDKEKNGEKIDLYNARIFSSL